MARAHNELPKNLLKRLATYRRVLATALDPAFSMPSHGKVLSPGDLVAAIDAFVAICDAVESAQLALQAALTTRTRGVPGAGELANQSKAYIRSVLGPNHPVLDQPFLRGPGGKHAISSVTQLKAAAARRETRKERKTMGKRQRERLKAR